MSNVAGSKLSHIVGLTRMSTKVTVTIGPETADGLGDVDVLLCNWILWSKLNQHLRIVNI